MTELEKLKLENRKARMAARDKENRKIIKKIDRKLRKA